MDYSKMTPEEKEILNQKINNGFDTRQEAKDYIDARKKDWDNLLAWIDEKDGKFFVRFNLYD